MRALPILILAAACGGSTPPPTTPADPAASPDPDPPVSEVLGWMVGRWESDQGIEHWTAAGDALFGISFIPRGGRGTAYEALMIRAVDGKIGYEAAPDGAPVTVFALSSVARGSVAFVDPAHDPMSITYVRNGDTLKAEVQGQGDALPLELSWKLAGPGSAPELEVADRAWSDAVGERGVDAWVEGFDPQGIQRPNSGPYITDAVARRKAMEPVLAGSFRLVWQPVASGWSPGRDLGYTVGTWRYLAGTVEKGRGAYMTIWRRQPDGSYKALYDAGDPEG